MIELYVFYVCFECIVTSIFFAKKRKNREQHMKHIWIWTCCSITWMCFRDFLFFHTSSQWKISKYIWNSTEVLKYDRSMYCKCYTEIPLLVCRHIQLRIHDTGEESLIKYMFNQCWQIQNNRGLSWIDAVTKCQSPPRVPLAWQSIQVW